jgi:hypothetical protein
MAFFLVWSDDDAHQRIISAPFHIAAASIYLGQPASFSPKATSEAHAPACRVAAIPRPRDGHAAIPFWRSGDGVLAPSQNDAEV